MKKVTDNPPPLNTVLKTAVIRDGDITNESTLIFDGKLWWTSDKWTSDKVMYVYYVPTHWDYV